MNFLKRISVLTAVAVGMVWAQPSQPDPSIFGVDALIKNMVAAMHVVEKAHNDSVVTNGKGKLWILNEDVIVKAENFQYKVGETREASWDGLFTEVTYVPPPVPVAVPSIKILTAEELYPGIFAGQVFNQPIPSVGTQVTQDGKTYQLILLGRTPFGSSFGWQWVK